MRLGNKLKLGMRRPWSWRVSNQDGIKLLAKAMGWTETKYQRWLSPDRKMRCDFPPDPFTDANDCEALIRWLNEKGVSVELHLDNNGYVVVFGYMNPDPFFSYEGDDWKQGVCELALKEIERV